MRRFYVAMTAAVLLVGSCDEDTPVTPVGNRAPIVTIRTPADERPEPSTVPVTPAITLHVSDPDGGPVEVRWTYVGLSLFGGNWGLAEDSIATAPGAFAWHEWVPYEPQSDAGMVVQDTVPEGRLLLAAQARDAGNALSAIGTASLRRILSCADSNAPPDINIFAPRNVEPNPSLVTPIVTISVYAEDPDNDKGDLAVRWLMLDTRPFAEDWDAAMEHVKNNAETVDWSPWRAYAPGDSTMTFQSPPMEFGAYVLAVQARDGCGNLSTLENPRSLRKVRISSDTPGPVLRVRNRFTGPVTAPFYNTPPVITEVLAGIPLAFEFSVWTSHGLLVSGYRYGWDITDLNDDSQWETEFTPYESEWVAVPPRTFYFDTHTFHVEAVDNSGNVVRATYVINIVSYAATRPLLLVDDYSADEAAGAGWESSNGAMPSDAEHDAFWREVLAGVNGFDSAFDVIDVDAASALPLTRIASYEAVIWSVYGDVDEAEPANLFHRYAAYRRRDQIDLDFGYRAPNALDQFIAVGGRFVIEGRHVLANTVDRGFAGAVSFPFLQLYDSDTREYPRRNPTGPPGIESFGYAVLCNDVLDYAIAGDLRADLCSVVSMRNTGPLSARDTGLREARPIDLSFPLLEMNARAAGNGHYYEEAARGYEAEVYNPPYFASVCALFDRARGCFEPIYGLHCLDTTEPTYGAPVAYWVTPDGGGARSAVFGFSLVYFEPAQVKQVVEHILFDEWGLRAGW